MPQVSIGQVENLEGTICNLNDCLEQARDECQNLIVNAEAKILETEQEVQNSNRLLAEAEEATQQAQKQLEQADQQMSEAELQLSDAQTNLSSCEASGSYGDDGDFIPPDCSGEMEDVSAAETGVDEARNALSEAEYAYEKAEARKQCMTDRLEMATRTAAQAQALAEATVAESNARLQAMESLVQTGAARLVRAQEALEAYLAANSEAKALSDWLHWQPRANTPVMPQDIHDRLNLSPTQQRLLLGYWADRDPSFRARLAGYREEIAIAKGPAEQQAVQLKMRKNLSGLFAEKLVETAFAPLGEKITVHVSKTTADGRVTIIDMVVDDLKAPLILGKGEGMAAPAGGSLAIEVKSGQAKYLKSQQDHMVFQATGHGDADASITICTRDIKDLSPEQEEELRAALKKAGSPLIGMLPSKDELDEACWDVVNGNEQGEVTS
jgi:hypothetical protein